MLVMATLGWLFLAVRNRNWLLVTAWRSHSEFSWLLLLFARERLLHVPGVAGGSSGADEGGGLFGPLFAVAGEEEASGVLAVLPVRDLAGVLSLFIAPLAARTKAQVNNISLDIVVLT